MVFADLNYKCDSQEDGEKVKSVFHCFRYMYSKRLGVCIEDIRFYTVYPRGTQYNRGGQTSGCTRFELNATV